MNILEYVYATLIVSVFHLKCISASAVLLGCPGAAEFYDRHKPTIMNRMTYNFICHRGKVQNLEICETILRFMTYVPWPTISEQFKNATVPDACVTRSVKYRYLNEEEDRYDEYEFEAAMFECPGLEIQGSQTPFKIHITRGSADSFNRTSLCAAKYRMGYCYNGSRKTIYGFDRTAWMTFIQ